MSPPPHDLGSVAPKDRSDTAELTHLSCGGAPYAVPVREFVPVSGRLAEATYRGFEILAAGFALAAALPILLIVAALVRWDSPGPPLFFHRRPGRSITAPGRELQGRAKVRPPPGGYEPERLYLVPSYFRLPKFRTMYADARARFP